jgi:four helix bundle protein
LLEGVGAGELAGGYTRGIAKPAYCRRWARCRFCQEEALSNTKIVTFRDLEVWQEAMDLAEACYKLTAGYPRDELCGLVAQTRRAAVSIPSNIAEGKVRPTSVYRNHVSIALGSQAELDTLFELAVRLKMVAPPNMSPLKLHIDRVGRMLHGLRSSLDQQLAKSDKAARKTR